MHAGTSDARQCIVALRSGALWLLLGCEPLIQLQLPASTSFTADQLLHFPQPPISAAMQLDSDAPQSADAFVFAPDETDDQFGASRRAGSRSCSGVHARCSVSELGSIVHVSHAHGGALLVHFACGANMQVSVDLQGASELVQKCFVALHSALLPTQMMMLLQRYHRCVRCSVNYSLSAMQAGVQHSQD